MALREKTFPHERNLLYKDDGIFSVSPSTRAMASESPYPTTMQFRPVMPLIMLASNLLQNESDLGVQNPTRFSCVFGTLEVEKDRNRLQN